MNIFGLIVLIIFYLIVLLVAIRGTKLVKDFSQNEVILAGKRLSVFVSTMTLTASCLSPTTWSGSTEIMLQKGLVWCQAPFCFSLAYLIGGKFLAEPLRELNIITTMDLFQNQYGKFVGSLYIIPTFIASSVFVSAMLNGLGVAIEPLLDIPRLYSVIFSSIFIGVYTSLGSMFAVSHTDVVQMIFMVFGIILCLPYIAGHDSVNHEKLQQINYLGDLESSDVWAWIDVGLAITFGLVCHDAVHHRYYSAKTTLTAKWASYASAVLVVLLSAPAIIVGYYVRVIDWETVNSFNRTILPEETANALPLAIFHLVPQWASMISLAALAAAAMSSADTITFSFAANFSRNVYKNILRTEASETEVVWVVKIASLIFPLLSAIVSIIAPSVYSLSILQKDFTFILMLPELLILLFWTGEKNSYGGFSALFVACLLRVLGGFPILGIPAIIQYPGYDVIKGQLFPHRTFTMLLVGVSNISVSWITKCLFSRGYLPKKYDILQVFTDDSETDAQESDERHVEHLLLNGRLETE